MSRKGKSEDIYMKNGEKEKEPVLSGILLRLERIKRGMGQKEVCYGICVPSYLSKIEHGGVCPDIELLEKLFARLGIVYEGRTEVLKEYKQALNRYFELLHYHLDTQEVFQLLQKQDRLLQFSPLALEWLLVQGLEGKGVLDSLQILEECMTSRQRAYYQIIRFRQGAAPQEAVEYCQQAFDVLDNCFSLSELCEAYILKGNYNAVHQLENRYTAIALEEGNTYYLADYFFLKGTAYACLNMEKMMMTYYERSIRFLQNTGWEKQLGEVYYNIGATYISFQRYDLAMEYLEKATEGIHTLHKKAIACIRGGRLEEGRYFLERFHKELLKADDAKEADILRYKEACMECEQDFPDKPEYLEVLEALIIALKRDYHLGHVLFYKDVMVEACKRQRRYKRALEFEKEISSRIINP